MELVETPEASTEGLDLALDSECDGNDKHTERS
jgi:hypothetical protein